MTILNMKQLNLIMRDKIMSTSVVIVVLVFTLLSRNNDDDFLPGRRGVR